MSMRYVSSLLISIFTVATLLTAIAVPEAAASDNQSPPAAENTGTESSDTSEASDRQGQADDNDTSQLVPFGFDFVPFVGTSSALPFARRTVSLNLVGGLSGGIEAIELGSALNLTRGHVRGAQLSGAANLITGDVDGLQGAGAVNVTGGASNGAQLAGAANIAVSDGSGLQGSGALNILGGSFDGLQASGAANIVVGDVSGAQLGVANIAGGRVDGLQLGVVNVAKNSTASIGLMQVMYDGFFELETVGSEEGLVMTGIRHGGDHVYNIYGIGARAGDTAVYPTASLGIGWRHELTDDIEISADLLGIRQFRQDFSADGSGVFLTKFRPLIAWRPNKFISLVAGPTLTVARTDANVNTDARPTPPWSTWQIRDTDPNVRLWPGLTLGARLL